jgi:hypothetical protein
MSRIIETYCKYLTPMMILLSVTFVPFTLAQGKAVLSGAVLDSGASRIPGAAIVLRGASREIRTTTSGSGEYNVVLRPGVYKVEVFPNKGFGVIRRGPFRLTAGFHSILNFRVYPRKSVVAPYESNRGETYDDVAMSEVLTDEVVVTHSGLRSGTITYGKKIIGSNNTQYLLRTFPGSLDSNPRPTFTYNLFAVRADTIEIDRSSRTLTAKGNVVMEENGVETRYADPIRLRIRNDRVQIIK